MSAEAFVVISSLDFSGQDEHQTKCAQPVANSQRHDGHTMITPQRHTHTTTSHNHTQPRSTTTARGIEAYDIEVYDTAVSRQQ